MSGRPRQAGRRPSARRTARRRVLVVAYYFPPVGGGGVNRTLKLVRGLHAAGVELLVLTVDRAAWPQDPALCAGLPEGVTIVRLPNPDWGRVRPARAGAAAGAGGGRLRRWLVPDLHVGWSALAAFATGLAAATRAVDAVYTTCPPYSANAAGRLARALGVPWIADFRDAWTLYPSRADLPPLRRAVERRLEEAVLRSAERVLFASEAVRRRYAARIPGLGPRSATALTGFDPREFAPSRGVAPPAGRLELVHAGSALRDARGDTTECFLDALADWRRREPAIAGDVRVRFVGAEAELAERVARRGLDGLVTVAPAVPRAALGATLRAAHACLYLAPAGAGGADCVPGKLFDAAGAERPLLAVAPEGPLADLVRRLGLGAVVPPSDPAALAEQLEALRARARLGRPIPGPAAAARAELCVDRFVACALEALEAVLDPEEVPCGCPSAS